MTSRNRPMGDHHVAVLKAEREGRLCVLCRRHRALDERDVCQRCDAIVEDVVVVTPVLGAPGPAGHPAPCPSLPPTTGGDRASAGQTGPILAEDWPMVSEVRRPRSVLLALAVAETCDELPDELVPPAVRLAALDLLSSWSASASGYGLLLEDLPHVVVEVVHGLVAVHAARQLDARRTA